MKLGFMIAALVAVLGCTSGFRYEPAADDPGSPASEVMAPPPVFDPADDALFRVGAPDRDDEREDGADAAGGHDHGGGL